MGARPIMSSDKKLRQRRSESCPPSSTSLSGPFISPQYPPSVRALTHFSLWYHSKLIFRQSIRLLWFLINGTPKWIREFLCLMCFVTALLPAFVVFTWHYLTCDRFCISYKEDGTSRHFLDIYGSRDYVQRSIEDDDNHTKKPVIVFLTGGAWIIGYKMWGTLLARALVPSDILVIVPDYRNFPQATVSEMIDDVDLAMQWIIDNCGDYGGDSNKIVLVGQSAGAHLGSCTMLRKLEKELGEYEHTSNGSSWKGRDVKGFVPVSGPFNLVAMQDHFHRRGLDRNIVSAIFSHNLENYSPTHILRSLQVKFGQDVCKFLPPVCIIHGTSDKSVPYEGAVEFSSGLLALGADVTIKLYDEWSHTDPIIESPMDGDHRLHKDLFDLVKNWTNDEKTTVSGFNETSPFCKRICPAFLIPIGRFCNPF